MLVSPGALISTDRGLLRGHGTYGEPDGSVRASVLGAVTAVARWVSVAPARARYTPEVGDIVVGRVREVAARRWIVDVGARCDAALPLAALHLSGGDQRRRTIDDQLAMRAVLAEGDLLCAEVHSLGGDGGLTLHARSLQYGRLANGVLVRAPPSAVPRQRAHVVALPPPLGVDVVMGVNGWVWLTGSLGLGSDAAAAGGDGLAIADELAEAIEARKAAAAEAPASPAQRRAVAALRAAVLFAAERGLPVTVDAIAAGAAALLAAPEAEDSDAVLAAVWAGDGAALSAAAGERGRR